MIKISINLPYVEGTREKLRRILRSHKIRSTFYTGNTLPKLLCKPKDQVATEDKNNIAYETDCSNREAVYFSESKWFLNRVEMNTEDLSRNVNLKRVKLQNTAGKQITTTASIRKLLTGKTGQLLGRSKKLYTL